MPKTSGRAPSKAKNISCLSLMKLGRSCHGAKQTVQLIVFSGITGIRNDKACHQIACRAMALERTRTPMGLASRYNNDYCVML